MPGPGGPYSGGVSNRSERDNVQELLKVARLYYEERRTQAEIATLVGFSRPTVSRLLAKALERGIVQIRIAHPLERILSIEGALKKKLDLSLIRVTESDTADSIDAIGRVAADLLGEILVDGQVLAVGNGRSIAATARNIPELTLPRTTVVQLLGSLPGGLPAWGRDSPTLCHQIADRLGTTSARMPIPLFVDDPALVEPLLREERVSTTLALAARADVAVVGVAGIHAHDEGERAHRLHDAGDRRRHPGRRRCGAHPRPALRSARPVRATPLSFRTLALSLESLRGIPLVPPSASEERRSTQ